MGSDAVWRLLELPGAGISVDWLMEWSAVEETRGVAERLPGHGSIYVRWGEGATIDDVLAHVGLGSGQRRIVEADDVYVLDGIPARRVQLRMVEPEAYAHGPDAARAPQREWIHVSISFVVDGTPVLLAYSLPESQFDAMTPLAEHVLASVRLL